MDFIRANLGNIAVGAVVFGILAAVTLRLISNHRKGKTSCGCGACTGCESGENRQTGGAS